ncbi:long-chain fatty acid--CoA ligase [Egibacter rhizosphaerae]|uniref:Long-chain fatty acid--CoA ligase n=1 Tax=Egibacter rhizosphaerae TaxID=1670831 RepID=A0A411YHG4_9ACTN|nr:AMP-binding protein [Egibacter rhizosphaerae]QBI20708.1 long-chain fatty acid--CoA ligase [Egibacter rhizosphaerae]
MTGELTLDRWIRDRAVVTPERVTIDCEGEATTYAELDRVSERVAAGLARAGAGVGSRVAVLAGNRPETVAVLFACAKLGAMLLPLNVRLAAPELAYQLDDSDAGWLLVGADYDAAADAALDAADTAVPQRVRLSWGALDELGSDEPLPVGVAPGDHDPLLLVYTSGTTGRPKGALLTHANCFWTNISLDRTIDVTGRDVVLQVLPQFHVGGWNVQPLLAWWKGATVVLETAFDAGRVLDLVPRKGVTTMMGVPALYRFLAQHERFADADLSSLRQAVVGGAPMPEALLETYLDRGVALVQGYGLTEAAPNVLGLPPEDAPRKVGYAGKPYLHVDVALRDTATGERLDGPATGERLDGPATGELLVRGPNVFPGYWRVPDATAAAVDADGWLATGDVAERDDEGFYRIRDRTKDMYVSGGENVYPAEVEAVLDANPAVADVAVVGVPDDRWGEAGLAAVVPAPGAAPDPDDLRAHCATSLARFKVPRDVVLVDELPYSSMNKVMKGELARRPGARA